MHLKTILNIFNDTQLCVHELYREGATSKGEHTKIIPRVKKRSSILQKILCIYIFLCVYL